MNNQIRCVGLLLAAMISVLFARSVQAQVMIGFDPFGAFGGWNTAVTPIYQGPASGFNPWMNNGYGSFGGNSPYGYPPQAGYQQWMNPPSIGIDGQSWNPWSPYPPLPPAGMNVPVGTYGSGYNGVPYGQNFLRPGMPGAFPGYGGYGSYPCQGGPFPTYMPPTGGINMQPQHVVERVIVRETPAAAPAVRQTVPQEPAPQSVSTGQRSTLSVLEQICRPGRGLATDCTERLAATETASVRRVLRDLARCSRWETGLAINARFDRDRFRNIVVHVVPTPLDERDAPAEATGIGATPERAALDAFERTCRQQSVASGQERFFGPITL